MMPCTASNSCGVNTFSVIDTSACVGFRSESYNFSVSALTITEKLYDPLLNPTHADVSITLNVLTPQELLAVQGIMGTLAKVAYAYSQGLRQAQAVANLGDASASIIGMLPNPF